MGLGHVMWVSVLTSTTSQKQWVCVMICGCLCSLLHLRSCGFVSVNKVTLLCLEEGSSWVCVFLLILLNTWFNLRSPEL